MRWLFIVIAGLAVEFGVAVLLGKCMAIGSGTHPRAPPLRIPTISAGHSGLMSATCSDRCRPAVPIEVGRGGARPLVRFGFASLG